MASVSRPSSIRAIEVRAFIRAELARGFVWGETDCVSTCDRWLRQACGRSPVAREVAVFPDEPAVRALLERPGGLLRLAARAMRKAGFERTDSPRAGDAGLVLHRGLVCAAIHAGLYWFSRDEGGAILAPPRAFAMAWSCPPR